MPNLQAQQLKKSAQKIRPTLQKSFIADYPLHIDSAIFRHQSSTHVIGLTYQNTNKNRHQKGTGNKDGRCGYRLCGRVTWGHHICLCWPAHGHTKSENADFSTPIPQSGALLQVNRVHILFLSTQIKTLVESEVQFCFI